MRKLATLIVAAFLVPSLVIPAVALGYRSGSESERKGILRADGAYPRLPLKCNWVVITTVKPGNWAAVQDNSTRLQHDKDCRLNGMGTDFLRKSNGRWRLIVSGPSDPPYHIARMPQAVTNDLTAGLKKA
ncbi:MAG: hypothetical protein WAK93_05945 [Solirubrobacteraceae bacterium]